MASFPMLKYVWAVRLRYPSFVYSKRLPDKSSIFTAELEALISALRYVKMTYTDNRFVTFSDSKSVLQAISSKWLCWRCISHVLLLVKYPCSADCTRRLICNTIYMTFVQSSVDNCYQTYWSFVIAASFLSLQWKWAVSSTPWNAPWWPVLPPGLLMMSYL